MKLTKLFMTQQPFPKTVVGVLVFKENKVLLGKRKKGDGSNEYAGPGGSLRFSETFEECAIRKVKEETGIDVKNVKIVALTNALHWPGAHYVDIEAVAEWESGEPKALDSEMIESWQWYDITSLPEPLIIGDKNGLAAIKENRFYFGTEL
ncbi:MAG: NUDIX domain-containing protein [Candidatus Doudnabacteria bacterium]